MPGWSGGAPRDDRFPGAGELYALYVNPQHQGQGVGGLLLHRTRLELKGKGYTGMLVKTLWANQRSRQFYESMGGQLAPEISAFEFDGLAYREAIYLFEI